jgi:hypothetical protein
MKWWTVRGHKVVFSLHDIHDIFEFQVVDVVELLDYRVEFRPLGVFVTFVKADNGRGGGRRGGRGGGFVAVHGDVEEVKERRRIMSRHDGRGGRRRGEGEQGRKARGRVL